MCVCVCAALTGIWIHTNQHLFSVNECVYAFCGFRAFTEIFFFHSLLFSFFAFFRNSINEENKRCTSRQHTLKTANNNNNRTRIASVQNTKKKWNENSFHIKLYCRIGNKRKNKYTHYTTQQMNALSVQLSTWIVLLHYFVLPFVCIISCLSTLYFMWFVSSSFFFYFLLFFFAFTFFSLCVWFKVYIYYKLASKRASELSSSCFVLFLFIRRQFVFFLFSYDLLFICSSVCVFTSLFILLPKQQLAMQCVHCVLKKQQERFETHISIPTNTNTRHTHSCAL